LCLIAIYFAGEKRDMASAVALALATGLKPQLGFWILFFYFLRLRWALVAGAILSLTTLVGIAIFRSATGLSTLMATYKDDLRYWFGPGGPNDFTAANPLHFQLVNVQVIFWQLFHDHTLANVLAIVVFVISFAALGYAVARGRVGSETLQLTTLIGLIRGFLPQRDGCNDPVASPWLGAERHLTRSAVFEKIRDFLVASSFPSRPLISYSNRDSRRGWHFIFVVMEPADRSQLRLVPAFA